jgi:hypothetical protein
LDKQTAYRRSAGHFADCMNRVDGKARALQTPTPGSRAPIFPAIPSGTL